MLTSILAVLLSVSAVATQPSTDPADNGWDEATTATTTAPVPAPPPVATQTPPTADEQRLWQLRQHNRFKGMMISGFTIAGSVYGASVLVGAIAIDLSRDDEGDDDRQRRYGRRMFIPLGGPFAAAPVSRSATLGVLTVAAGAGQILGLSLGIAGAVKLREYPHPDRNRFAFGVAPTGDGGAQIGVLGRF